MQLSDFSGGLSVRLDATRIQPNEAVLYTNVDNTDTTLKSAKSYLTTDIEARDNFYKFGDVWLSSFVDRDYIEYDNVLYFTEQDGRPKKTKDGAQLWNLGIEKPKDNILYEVDGITPLVIDGIPKVSIFAEEVAPIGDEDPISGEDITAQYTYTYWNDTDGTESAPATLSNEVEVTAGQVVELTNIQVSNDPQVTHIRIYRLGLNTTMQFVKQIPNNLNETRDAVPVLELGAILDTYDNQPAPLGLRYLTEAYGILFGVVGNTLYYSKQGKPNYWPAGQSFLIKKPITGLLPVQNGVFVYTLAETVMLVGSNIADFEIIPVSDEYGCNSHKSCKLVKNTPVWSCLDGFASWSNGYIQIISKDKLGKFTMAIKNTAVSDETYFVLDTAGNVIAMDLRFGLVFKDYDFLERLVDIGTFEGILYSIVKERVVRMFEGEDLEFQWRSGELAEGTVTMVKSYNNVYIRFRGDFVVKVYINDELVSEKTLSSPNKKLEDMKVPQELQRGETIQFDIVGTGKVWEIEYKPVGRENGR